MRWAKFDNRTHSLSVFGFLLSMSQSTQFVSLLAIWFFYFVFPIRSCAHLTTKRLFSVVFISEPFVAALGCQSGCKQQPKASLPRSSSVSDEVSLWLIRWNCPAAEQLVRVWPTESDVLLLLPQITGYHQQPSTQNTQRSTNPSSPYSPQQKHQAPKLQIRRSSSVTFAAATTPSRRSTIC